MKFFVTGVAGQLGHDTMMELHKRGFKAVGSDLKPKYSGIKNGLIENMPYIPMDITNIKEVREVLFNEKPTAIIHCAAWTAVDAAEDYDKKDLVMEINGKGTENIAHICKELDIPMMYISTDYVFNGEGTTPWDPDCKDYSPLNIYGKSKLAGEEAVSSLLDKYFIVRIAWVFGENGNNFIKTMLKVGSSHPVLTVVNDQIGTPTYTYDLARLLVDMILTDKYGYYHATNEGDYISWFDFADKIFETAREKGLDQYDNLIVNPVTTEEYGVSKAKRPFNSRLNRQKLVDNGFTPLPTWEDALSRYIDLLIKKGF